MNLIEVQFIYYEGENKFYDFAIIIYDFMKKMKYNSFI